MCGGGGGCLLGKQIQGVSDVYFVHANLACNEKIVICLI